MTLDFLRVPPAAGAEVMGTGIVSIALSLDGWETLSRLLLLVATTMWATLALLLPARALGDRSGFRRDVRSPAALTAPAGTAVLGTRLTMLGWTWAGVALLVVAVGCWAALLAPVMVNWRTPTVGSSLLLSISTEALAVLAATIGVAEQAGWLVAGAIAPLALGLGFYAFAISRFDLRQLGTGRGDHWTTGGALAISALAAGKIAGGTSTLAILAGGAGALATLAVGLWVAAMLWLPVLVLAEAMRPRLGYDLIRWATVFPVGMYAACSFVVGSAAGLAAATRLARVWVWVAVAVWGAVFAGMIVTARRG